MISLVIPFIDSWDITKQCIETVASHLFLPAELVIIDNGSDKTHRTLIADLIKDTNFKKYKYIRNKENIGVLGSFKQGYENSTGDIVCYIHNDVLIHQDKWDVMVNEAFANDDQLGMAGIFGARGVYADGGREGCMSHMLGQVWGKTEVRPAALHHGELMTGVSPCVMFDGVGLFFRREALQWLVEETDMFADWRAPHHFYDRIMSLKVLQRGYHLAVIGLQFDHYSGATANHSQKYVDSMQKWCDANGYNKLPDGWDQTIYWIAEKQWRDEFASLTPVHVDQGSYNVRWRG